MATVVLPRSLAAILPGAERRLAVADGSVATVIDELETRIPGVRNRLCDAGPTLRQHLNVFVDGQRADLDTRVEAGSTVHVIPAVSGGSRNRGREPNAGLDRSPSRPWSRCAHEATVPPIQPLSRRPPSVDAPGEPHVRPRSARLVAPHAPCPRRRGPPPHAPCPRRRGPPRSRSAHQVCERVVGVAAFGDRVGTESTAVRIVELAAQD